MNNNDIVIIRIATNNKSLLATNIVKFLYIDDLFLESKYFS